MRLLAYRQQFALTVYISVSKPSQYTEMLILHYIDLVSVLYFLDMRWVFVLVAYYDFLIAYR
jgi:hypothetical protein